MLSKILTLGIPLLVLTAFFVLWGWVIKVTMIDKKPIGTGRRGFAEQALFDLSNDQNRQALSETVEMRERPDLSGQDGNRDPEDND